MQLNSSIKLLSYIFIDRRENIKLNLNKLILFINNLYIFNEPFYDRALFLICYIAYL